MKRWYYALWCKCAAIALLIVFAALFCASALGAAYLASYQAYTDGGETVRELARSAVLQPALADGLSAFDAYAAGDEPTLALTLEKYQMARSNIYFELTDVQSGAVLLSTGEQRTQHYSFAYSAYLQQELHALSDDSNEVTAQLHVYLREPLAVKDRAYTVLHAVDRLIGARFWLISLALVFLALCVALFIFLLCVVGHKPDAEGIFLCWFNRIPLDVLLLLLVFPAVFGIALLDRAFHDEWLWLLRLLYTGLFALALVLSVAARAKAPGLFRNTLIWRICSWVCRALAQLPLVWRSVLVWGGFCVLDLLFLMCWNRYGFAIWLLLSRGALTLVLLYLASGLKRLQQQGQALADGSTELSPPTLPRWMPALRRHAENLQSIQCGIQKAVAEQTRAERMKAELITNVSHDIKTPLTSIINYVDLLKKEDIQPQRAREYVCVLDRQAARLKKLTEDLIEASKASSGAVAVHLAKTDVNVLLSQLLGEYADRLHAAEVEPVFKPAPSQPMIEADGKLLSRVLGNLFSNVCKYAMPGTRAYFESIRQGQEVRITFKNISRFALDLPANELTARFVRGDRSRHTEGSGLGLSIAKSLTELQGGSFQLEIDGDLFKAVLVFPSADSSDAS